VLLNCGCFKHRNVVVSDNGNKLLSAKYRWSSKFTVVLFGRVTDGICVHYQVLKKERRRRGSEGSDVEESGDEEEEMREDGERDTRRKR